MLQIVEGMAVSFSKVENYLSRIGLKCANVEFCHLEGKVPLSLSEYYEARVGNLLGSRYLFLMLTGERPNPDALIRQVVAFSRYYSERPIVLFGELDAEYYDRLNALHPMGMGQTEDVAKSILFLLSDMSSWMTGAILNVDGGFTAQ